MNFKLNDKHVIIGIIAIVAITIFAAITSSFTEPSESIQATPVYIVDEPYADDPDELIEDYKLAKDYQLELISTGRGDYAIMWDRGRLVSVMPLDNHCNLTFAIDKDNN